MKNSDALRYPVGIYEYGSTYTFDETRRHIKTIAALPDDLKKILKKLNTEALNKSYRKGGWSVRQIVHHLADSSMNAYIRMKLAVTEPTPIIKPYEEDLWAETEDGRGAPIKISLKLLSALTRRWEYFLESLSSDDLDRGYFHPEMQRIVMLQDAIAAYAWHARHHLAHIKLVLNGSSFEAGSASSYRADSVKAKVGAAETATPAEDAPKKRGPKPKVQSGGTQSSEVDTLPKKRGPKPKVAAEGVASVSGEPKKRGPKPKVAAEGVASVSSEPKKRGPKPKVAVEGVASVSSEPKKRGPKPKVAAEGIASVSSEPKKRGPKPKVAAEGVASVSSEPKKRGPKPKVAAESVASVSSEPKKRGPKPKVASESAVAVSSEPKKRGPKPKVAVEGVASVSSEPKKRGPKPKVASENAVAVSSEPKKRGPKPKEKPAKVVVEGEEKKRRGMSPEHMAKIRAARVAKREALGIVTKVKIVDPNAPPKKRGPKAKEKPAKVVVEGEVKKHKGMSPEHMEKIRAKRMENLAAKKAAQAAALENKPKG
jgi:hypothetical protein